MNIPDMPIQVEVDPNEDTEWNDILRKHKIIPEKPEDPTPKIEEALTEARRLAHEHRLEGKDLDALDELEDDEDDDFLEQYRQKRTAELSTISTKSVYNQVYPLQKPDWSREVTDESQKAVMIEVWRELAHKFGDVKFGQIRADLCIEGYPDKNTPTIVVYKDGDVKRQIVTMAALNGPRTGLADMERVLVEVGAIKHGDVRLKQKEDDEKQPLKSLRSSAKPSNFSDEDSDWD